jgi:deoxyribonuclease-4
MAHLGSFKDKGKEEGLVEVIKGLKTTLEGYEGSTQFLIELSAGAGAAIGSTFEDLAEIIYHKDLEKFDIGVCYDTAHTFANSYDIRSSEMVEQTFKHFDKILGLKKLKIFHCNDSKIEFGGKKDRHEHIGKGFIGRAGFEALLHEPAIKHLNWFLETEPDGVQEDIDILKAIRSET